MKRLKNKLINNQSGFTIIELLIASLVFSTILLVTTYGIIEVSQIYIKGYFTTIAQNQNRSLQSELTQSIQENDAQPITIAPLTAGPGINSVSSEGNVYWFCINNVRYTYKYNSHPGILIKDEDPTGDNCQLPANVNGPLSSGQQELLSPDLSLVPTKSGSPAPGIINTITTSSMYSSGSILYSLNIQILYGDSGTFTILPTGFPACNSLLNGGDFCADSISSTTVQERSSLE
jgi:prepilin-type N-terminal cleavage/methylation domain-containing protein